eukprot:gene30183-37352_t
MRDAWVVRPELSNTERTCWVHMVFELMNLTLFDCLQQYYRRGMPTDKIRHFMRHLLQ